MMYSIIFVDFVQNQTLNLLPMLFLQYFILVDVALDVVKKSYCKEYYVLPAISTDL